MGSLCIVSKAQEEPEGKQEIHHLLQQSEESTENKQKLDNNQDDNEEDNESSASGKDEEDERQIQTQKQLDKAQAEIQAMQKEIILLATRNANLQQQLEEANKQLEEKALLVLKQGADAQSSKAQLLKQQSSIQEIMGLASALVPVLYICEELGINPAILPKQVDETDQIESFLKQIDSSFTFSAKQSQFLNAVTEDIEDAVLGLLNVLLERKKYQIFYKCIMMEMVSFLYHETEDELDDESQEGPKSDPFDLQIVYSIANVLDISQTVVDEIDTMIKQRLGTDSQFESLFVQNGDAH